jgi:uncharacterized protein (DUF1501 family)
MAGAARMVPLPGEPPAERVAADPERGLTRRGALGAGLGLVLATSALASPARMMEAAAADAAASPDATVLVSLYLDGGNDGLNTLVPLLDPRYRELRPRIAIAPESTLPLPGVAEFGWHPSLTGLKKLYDAGQVAVLPSVDYRNPDLSHFNSAGFWRTGVVGKSADGSGWLGRALEVVGGTSNPLQGICVSGDFDPVLASHRAPVAQVADPGHFGFWIPEVWEEEAFIRAYRDAALGGRSGARRAAQAAFRQAFSVRDRLKPLAEKDGDTLPPTPEPYPEGQLGDALRNLGRMLGAGLGTRVAAVSASDSFDTHEGQPEEHAKMLRELGDALWAWQADLRARGLSHRVLTLVWSEFGRRPEDNASLGTDHGAGGLVLLVGDRAHGGIRSEFPGLATLDRHDNLLVSTEFRTVYATLLESWLGVEAARVLPGIDAGRLALVR